LEVIRGGNGDVAAKSLDFQDVDLTSFDAKELEVEIKYVMYHLLY
jgi:hypothetical protein